MVKRLYYSILDVLLCCKKFPTVLIYIILKFLFLSSQCLSLVDYYAPLLFLEASTIQPVELCRKVNLCQQIVLISRQLREDSCVLCHRVISEVLTKLKDPDAQVCI